MNELCFVWGAPLSGQRIWMLRAARESEDGVDVRLLSLDALSDPQAWPGVLARLEGVLAESASSPRHIYCELPWAGVEDGLALEEWLQSRPEFQPPVDGPPSWALSFVGLCPAGAELLPEDYRVGYEEFSRGAQSVIIVPKARGGVHPPAWLESGALDFGRRVEVFEEEIWNPEDFESIVERDEGDTRLVEGLDTLQTMSFVIEADRVRLVEILKDLRDGAYGHVWGAEILWADAKARNLLILTQGKIFSAQSTHPSLEHIAPMGKALFQVSGEITQAAALLAALQTQAEA